MSYLKISVSDLMYYSECRRKWWWQKAYSAKIQPPYFFVGNIVHDGLEGFYSEGPEKAIEMATATANKTLDEVSENSVLFGGDDANAKYEELADLGLKMLNNYFTYEAIDPLMPGGKIEHIEKTMRHRIKLSGWHYEGIMLTGRADLLVRDSKGQLWVVDHKTSNSYTPGLSGLDVDDQLTAYMYLCWKTLGEMPVGVLYNVLLKKVPEKPRVLKSGKLSKAKDQGTTVSLYMEAINEMGLDPGDYADILEYLDATGWEQFFFREYATRNESELLAYQNRLIVKATEVASIFADPDTWAVPSPKTRDCTYCEFLSACKSADDGGDPEVILETTFKKNKRYSGR